jgi:hypothetical protein
MFRAVRRIGLEVGQIGFPATFGVEYLMGSVHVVIRDLESDAPWDEGRKKRAGVFIRERGANTGGYQEGLGKTGFSNISVPANGFQLGFPICVIAPGVARAVGGDCVWCR